MTGIRSSRLLAPDYTRHQLSGGAQGLGPVQMLLQSGGWVGEQVPPGTV